LTEDFLAVALVVVAVLLSMVVFVSDQEVLVVVVAAAVAMSQHLLVDICYLFQLMMLLRRAPS